VKDFLAALPLYLAAVTFIGMAVTVYRGLAGQIARRTEDGLNGALGLATAVCLALYPHWLSWSLAVLNAIVGAVGVHHWVTRGEGPAVIPGTRWLVRLLARLGIRQG
jgi:hypothetical protein